MIFNPVYVSSLGETDFDFSVFSGQKNYIQPNMVNNFLPGMVAVFNYASSSRGYYTLVLVFCDRKAVITIEGKGNFEGISVDFYTTETITVNALSGNATQNYQINFNNKTIQLTSGSGASSNAIYYLPD